MSMTSGKQNRVAAGLRRRGALLAAALRPPGAGRPAGPSPGGEDDGAVAPSKVPRLVESPVFVLCSVRSGSTLLRVLLNSHSRIRAPHELHLRHLRVRPGRDFTHDIMGELGLDVRELEYMLWDNVLAYELRRSGKAQIVDKTPSNVLIWRRLAAAWPRARYIFLLRHPASTVESVLARRKGAVPEEVVPEILRYTEHIEQARGELSGITVRYEELTAEPERVTKDVCAYLGLEWEPGMLDYGGLSHGPYRAVFGDWGEKLKSGEVQPARPLPAADAVPAELRDIARAWNYL
ncbi:sulfotransferase family protein [Actinomadura hallensis]|uniref:Sulfotransferase family protein n=1 Tax=Actinomadura hallensis TaxID=337895 RepID=A0A543IFU6_9ACTN|nr:sulfotransferase [Actinomadura hallensis]TQM69427.1 sulfotransferase family protein [Actinomadura hallensis]